MASMITVAELKGMFRACDEKIAANRSRLIELDSVAGDGDLGLSMNDGFRAVTRVLADTDETDLGKLLYLIGKTLSSHAPSSAGTLLSSGIINSAKALRGAEEMGVMEFTLMWEKILEGIVSMGGARRGDKTMIEAIAPAVDVLKGLPGNADPASAARAAGKASAEGAQSTVGMIAVHGRAAVRGEDSRGMVDPGAVLVSLIFQAMAEYVETIFA